MSMSGIFSGLSVAASGMSVQRVRLNVIASNIANANSVRTEDGLPYRRKEVHIRAVSQFDFEEIISSKKELFSTNRSHLPAKGTHLEKNLLGSEVEIKAIRESDEGFKLVYDPSSPYADSAGFVARPNVNPVEEMVKMIEAQRAYEANVSSFAAIKAMLQRSLEII